MASADDINDAVAESATGPRRVQIGPESVEQHPLKDQIDAENHVAGKTAKSRNHFGLRFTQLIPPGGAR